MNKQKQTWRKVLMGLFILIAAVGVGITTVPIPKNNRDEFQVEINDENEENEISQENEKQ